MKNYGNNLQKNTGQMNENEVHFQDSSSSFVVFCDIYFEFWLKND